MIGICMDKETSDFFFEINIFNSEEKSDNEHLTCSKTKMNMITNVSALFLLLMSQDLVFRNSVSGSKRVVFQTFFDNLQASCYGTCTTRGQGMGSATRNVRCQGNRVRLECERGNVVKTDLAFYGELEPGKELCKDVSQVLEQCHKDVSDIVKKDCDDKQFCVFAIDRRFKDLCLAKYFYLDIRYSCEFQPSTSKPTTTNIATTTQQKTTTRRKIINVKTTRKQTSAAKPITIYKETTGKTTDTTTDITKASSSSSTTGNTKSRSSSIGTSSKSSSSSSSTTQSVPINAPTTAAPDFKSYSPTQKLNITVVNSDGRTGGKTSMYWLLTAYSLVTDKSFIQANFTHLVLAIILSIFIALVLSICFILDHCRRRRRYQALKELATEEQQTSPGAAENGNASIDLEMRRGLIRPKNKPRGGIRVSNGGPSNPNSQSLEEINHNLTVDNERLSLIPLAASLGSINRNGLEETSFLMRSSTSERLPPPPEELLLDTPRQTKSSLLDNESCSSTISIPPPIGFGDSEHEDTEDGKKPDLIITSPTPTNSSMSSANKESVLTATSCVNISKRLNNEMYKEVSKSRADSNLLHNHVSIQTNDLTQGNDRTLKLDNPGHVSMRSPFFELPDAYITPDKESEIANVRAEFKNEKLSCLAKNEENTKQFFSMPDAEYQVKRKQPDNCKMNVENVAKKRAIKGKLVVIKNNSKAITQSSDEKRLGNDSYSDRTLEVASTSSDDNNFSSSDASLKVDKQLPCNISQMETTFNDSESRKQIFNIPEHRCGLGHAHSCNCTPLRTGNNSFICSCLEKAKYKSSACCVEKCPEQFSASREPYSSQRPQRGRHSDTLKRKNNQGKKRTSSLTDLSADFFSEKTVSKAEETRGANAQNRQWFASKSSTLSRIPSKTEKVQPDSKFSLSLDRKLNKQHQRASNGIFKNKLIAVTVHSSKKPKGSHTSPFGSYTSSNEHKSEEKIKAKKTRIPYLSRSEESSDSSDKSDEPAKPKSLPTSPTGKSSLKNGKVRLSPISEDSKRNTSSGYASWTKRAPKFKIQVVQSLETNKRKPVNEV